MRGEKRIQKEESVTGKSTSTIYQRAWDQISPIEELKYGVTVERILALLIDHQKFTGRLRSMLYNRPSIY